MTKEKEKNLEIKWVDGMPCIVVQDGTFIVNSQHQQIEVYKFGNVQELRESNVIPDIIKELKDIFNQGSYLNPFFELGEKEEEKKDVNEE